MKDKAKVASNALENVSRRSFLGGALALVGTAVVPLKAELFASVPVIYGDGQHDDRPGLQAMIDDKPFRVAGDCHAHRLADGSIYLSAGTYFLGDAITVSDAPVYISDCSFECATDTALVLKGKGAKGSHLRNISIRTNRKPSRSGGWAAVTING